MLRLVKEADVLVENFRPGVMKKLNLDYEELKKVNPRLIYASISGFGQTGPMSQVAGYDPLVQAMSGISSVTGFPEGDPIRCGAPVCDILAAVNAAYAIVAALYCREKSGVGQMIDIALIDQGILAGASVNQFYLSQSALPQRLGNGYAAGVPGNLYHAKDGNYMYAGSGDEAWRKICESWGRPELVDDPRYKDRTARTQHREAVDKMMNDWSADKTVEECITYFKNLKLACGPILNIEQVYHHPHFGADGVREMFTKVDYPGVGEIKITNQAVKMSATPPKVRCAPPTLGQHNTEVLAAIGYSQAEIESFTEQGII